MKRSNQVSVDLGDALHSKLESLVKSTNKSKSDLIKLAVYSMCHAIVADISIESKDITKLISDGKSNAKKKPRSLTEEDHVLISTWRSVFGLSDKVRIFAPAVLKTIWNARRAGLTQEELIALIQASPRNRWVIEQVNAGVAPPLSALLSEKMIPHLLMLIADGDNGGDSPNDELEEYKRDIIDKYWDKIPQAEQDSFRNTVIGLSSIQGVDAYVTSVHGDSW